MLRGMEIKKKYKHFIISVSETKPNANKKSISFSDPERNFRCFSLVKHLWLMLLSVKVGNSKSLKISAWASISWNSASKKIFGSVHATDGLSAKGVESACYAGYFFGPVHARPFTSEPSWRHLLPKYRMIVCFYSCCRIFSTSCFGRDQVTDSPFLSVISPFPYLLPRIASVLRLSSPWK